MAIFSRKNPEVLVTGAGPVGLVTALALARHGIDVQILDEQWRTAGRSYALALHPGSLRLLAELGVGTALARRGQHIKRLSLRNVEARQAEIDVDALGGDFPFVLVVPQRVLESLLEEELRKTGVRVQWSRRVAGIELGGERPLVEVERLAKESTGYAFAETAWVVERVRQVRPRFLVGADGHRSTVRRLLGVPFAPVGEPLLCGVFELLADAPDEGEVVVVLDTTTNVLWPMGQGRFRWSFELFEWEAFAEARVKDRLQVQVGSETLPYVSQQMLSELIAERAPWFTARIQEVVWSAAVRFERRLAESFASGPAFLLGDAAHLAAPAGVHSMNVGLREGVELANRIAAVLRQDAAPETLADWADQRQAEWRTLLGLDGPPRATPEATPWVRSQAERVLPCIPAGGEELDQLLAQIGLAMPRLAAVAS
ncbi:MAG TPA: FAD-dependent monooxygenase [Thermoanaerobaculia bacterium]|nr:FAD-dependent monooxygenase [Thermoanaerobaculia bacterium]